MRQDVTYCAQILLGFVSFFENLVLRQKEPRRGRGSAQNLSTEVLRAQDRLQNNATRTSALVSIISFLSLIQCPKIHINQTFDFSPSLLEFSTYTQWSGWQCDGVCYNFRKTELTETRTRTCIDSRPKHSKINCEMMTHTKDLRRGCTTVNQCKYTYDAIFCILSGL